LFLRFINAFNTSPFQFERLNIKFLDLYGVLEILKNTKKHNLSLVEYYVIPDSQLVSTAAKILEISSGHPRSLLEMLHDCENLKDLLEYKTR
jgi:hypothetical protein